MLLTEHEKEIANAICNNEVTDLRSYILKYIQYTKDINRGSHYMGTGYSFQAGSEIWLIADEEEVARKLRQLLAFCNKLKNMGFVFIPDKASAKSIPPLFKFSGSTPVPAEAVIDVLFHNSSFEITPSLDLGAFIEHNFMTVDERRFSEEQRSRISAQRWTIGISIAGLILGTLTSLGVAYFNFKTYSKDRQVTITNLQQLPKPLQVVITSADATALKPTTVSGLTPSSTRTPPALPSALSRHPASPAPLSGSVQAVPVSSNR